MARLNNAIDVTDEKGGLGEFEPVPAGVYPAQIVSAEEEPTKDGSSWMLKMQFSIVGPNYPGRRIWGRVITSSSDAQKMAAGKRHLANLLDALGVGRRISDTDVLLNKVTPIKVKYQAATEQHPASNNIVEYGVAADPSFRPANDVLGTASASAAAPKPGLKKPPMSF